MTFLTAKTELAERAHDTSSGHLTRCGEWLNLTKDEIVAYADWEWLQATDDLAITAGDQEYAFTDINSNVDRIHSIRIETDGGWKLLPYPQSEFDSLMPDPDLETGRPEAYAIWARTIVFDRDPDDNYTAQIRYYKTIADLSADGDTPPWKSEWDWVWLLGGTYYAQEFEKLGSGERTRNRFEAGLRQMYAKSGAYNPRIIMSGFARGNPYPFGSPWPRHRFGVR